MTIQRVRSYLAIEAGLHPNHRRPCPLPEEQSNRSKSAPELVLHPTTFIEESRSQTTSRRSGLGSKPRSVFSTRERLSPNVKLPNEHAIELTTATGVRPKLWNIDWDFGWTYFAYPGGTPAGPSIDYWEVGGRADTKLTDSLHVAAGFAYSPNFSNTGAWSKYAAFGLGIDLPSSVLPKDVAASVTAGVGYYWFGNQSAALGGFALPAYYNWNAGLTFKRKIFSLDLRYYDTNLSKENCFVFTGDPNASPGGQINPLTNPEGLTSGWCSATFVAKFGFELD